MRAANFELHQGVMTLSFCWTLYLDSTFVACLWSSSSFCISFFPIGIHSLFVSHSLCWHPHKKCCSYALPGGCSSWHCNLCSVQPFREREITMQCWNVFLNMKRRSINNLGHLRLIMRSRDTACLLECRVVSRSGYVTRYAVSWYCKQMIVSALNPDHFRPCPANSDLFSMHSLPRKSCRWWWKSKQRLNALCRAPWRSLLTVSKVSRCSVVLLKQRTVHLLQQQRQKQV